MINKDLKDLTHTELGFNANLTVDPIKLLRS